MAGEANDLETRFPTCRCALGTCLTCRRGWQLTPRMAAALQWAATVTADEAYHDIEIHGDEPVSQAAGWFVFPMYPRSTWTETAEWRRRIARTYHDLADDVDAGLRPRPHCLAEELALYILLVRLKNRQFDTEVAPTLCKELAPLARHPDDTNWPDAWENLSRNDDALSTYIDTPAQRPSPGTHWAWFDRFDGMPARDTRT